MHRAGVFDAGACGDARVGPGGTGARVDAGVAPLHLAEVDVAELLDETVAELVPTGRAVSFSVDVADGLVARADRARLRQLVVNLLDNAVKYSNGQPQISVQAAAATPDTAWVRVRDAGIGIPKAQLGRIFNRFYRFQPLGSKVKGTGLGLYIVRSIAKRHGGRVFAESIGENKGATFTLELPRVPN